MKTPSFATFGNLIRNELTDSIEQIFEDVKFIYFCQRSRGNSDYCFAEEGEYHGRRALMSYETGKQALDFLIANSGNRKNLEVDFFGGEPLMNFDVVKQLVAYGREQEKLHDKHFRFTLTTNGVLLNDDIMEFANKEMDNVVLSIDGRKEVNDRMRPFRKGAGEL